MATGTQLYAFFEELVGDSPSDSWFYSVLNAKKDGMEASRPWAYLKKIDSSNSRLTSDTWQTFKTLPSDFGTPLRLHVGTDRNPYTLVPFDRIDLKDTDGTWRLDLANSAFSFNGVASEAGTAYLMYQRFTPAITSSTSPVFPDRFHQILAYDCAEQWFAKDQSERGLAWNQEQAQEAQALLDSMILWDERIKQVESNQDPSPEGGLDLS